MVSVMAAHQAWPGDQPPPPAGCPPFLPQARLFLLHCAASTFLCLLVLLADLLSQSISLALASESLFLAFPRLSTPLRVCRSPSVFVSVSTSPRVSLQLSLFRSLCLPPPLLWRFLCLGLPDSFSLFLWAPVSLAIPASGPLPRCLFSSLSHPLSVCLFLSVPLPLFVPLVSHHPESLSLAPFFLAQALCSHTSPSPGWPPTAGRRELDGNAYVTFCYAYGPEDEEDARREHFLPSHLPPASPFPPTWPPRRLSQLPSSWIG